MMTKYNNGSPRRSQWLRWNAANDKERQNEQEFPLAFPATAILDSAKIDRRFWQENVLTEHRFAEIMDTSKETMQLRYLLLMKGCFSDIDIDGNVCQSM